MKKDVPVNWSGLPRIPMTCDLMQCIQVGDIVCRRANSILKPSHASEAAANRYIAIRGDSLQTACVPALHMRNTRRSQANPEELGSPRGLRNSIWWTVIPAKDDIQRLWPENPGIPAPAGIAAPQLEIYGFPC